MLADNQIPSSDQVNLANAGLDAFFPEPPTFQFAMPTQGTDQEGVRGGLDGCPDEILLGREDPDVHHLESPTLERIGHDLVPHDMRVHAQNTQNDGLLPFVSVHLAAEGFVDFWPILLMAGSSSRPIEMIIRLALTGRRKKIVKSFPTPISVVKK